MFTVMHLLRDQCIEKEIEIGRKEAIQEDIEKLLSKGILSPAETASVLEVNLAWVEEIARKIAGKK